MRKDMEYRVLFNEKEMAMLLKNIKHYLTPFQESKKEWYHFSFDCNFQEDGSANIANMTLETNKSLKEII